MNGCTKPSQQDINNALATLEAAGFSVIDGRRLSRHHQERRPAYVKAIDDAGKGDKGAAILLVKWFATDLSRAPGPLHSQELFRYFAGVMQAIVRDGDAAKALNLKPAYRPRSAASKLKNSLAFILNETLSEDLAYGDRISEIGEIIAAENPKRAIAAGKREKKAFDDIEESCRVVEGDAKSPGVIVIT
ncbi:MAG TPA: hypothetical protein VMV91_09460 [Rhodocyclaceae bacterium]|nr:hypothetical protein [Rhodocyclaceae bacterium]HUX24253.1 hypothetical protein [Burkholderiales bacterium]